MGQLGTCYLKGGLYLHLQKAFDHKQLQHITKGALSSAERRYDAMSVHGSTFLQRSLNMLLILQVVPYSRAKKMALSGPWQAGNPLQSRRSPDRV